jgi:phosphatidylserine/phosphatidylglycerophosphate/cardiolipin synthase-like enzyme
MIEPHFGDIRSIILENLSNAKFDIYVAVAWFTDKQIFEILMEKSRQGLNVEVVIVNDEINLGNQFNYNLFTEQGGKLFWDNHHHKFCVIDREIVITGSYNWTYMANNRLQRENVIVIKHEKELIDKYSIEFRTLLRSAIKYELKPKIEYIEKQVEVIKQIEVEKIIENTIFINRPNNLLLKQHKDRLNWWRQLNKEWKAIFSQILDKEEVLEFPSKDDLLTLFGFKDLDFRNFQISSINPLLEMGNLQTLKFDEIQESQYKKLIIGLSGIQIEANNISSNL